MKPPFHCGKDKLSVGPTLEIARGEIAAVIAPHVEQRFGEKTLSPIILETDRVLPFGNLRAILVSE